MKRLFFAFVLFASSIRAGEIKITFIGNEAFHITDGETTILSDFPYKSGAYGYMQYEMKDVPPIKDGLSLITHFHADHWDKSLFEKMDLHIIAPQGILDSLTTEKKIALAPDMTFKDIEIHKIDTPHRLAPQHHSYLVTWHGKKFYFVGDTETPEKLLEQKNLDVAFVTTWLMRILKEQNLKIDAKTVIPYHQKLGAEIPDYMDCKALKQGETFTLEYKE